MHIYEYGFNKNIFFSYSRKEEIGSGEEERVNNQLFVSLHFVFADCHSNFSNYAEISGKPIHKHVNTGPRTHVAPPTTPTTAACNFVARLSRLTSLTRKTYDKCTDWIILI